MPYFIVALVQALERRMFGSLGPQKPCPGRVRE